MSTNFNFSLKRGHNLLYKCKLLFVDELFLVYKLCKIIFLANLNNSPMANLLINKLLLKLENCITLKLLHEVNAIISFLNRVFFQFFFRIQYYT